MLLDTPHYGIHLFIKGIEYPSYLPLNKPISGIDVISLNNDVLFWTVIGSFL